ncbi:MAG TPA: nuclear transport factor 2 family protein [Holophagaceae bacterium]|nr:nuclear transport factor 2 family protein [Holophagaceae bacterium]
MRGASVFMLPTLLLARAPAEKPIAAVLDDWHEAAAQADEARYFGHMAEDAVFLGTDATERWSKAAFQAYAHPYFAKGKAWTFRAVRRAISLSADGRTAWFDEDLETANMGPCRGSGVLAKRHGRWLIVQYNLSVPIPNARMKEVLALIGGKQP